MTKLFASLSTLLIPLSLSIMLSGMTFSASAFARVHKGKRTTGTQTTSGTTSQSSTSTVSATTTPAVTIGTQQSVTLSAFGVAGQGGDDTAVIQQALNVTASSGETLEIPAAAQAYNVRPLFLPSNTNLLLDANVTIQATHGYGQTDQLLNIEDVNNVTVIGTAGSSVFQMPRQDYANSQYRDCLRIAGANNVTIAGISCNNSGGDGLYIGEGAQGYSSNVSVSNSTFSNNMRQGMSITSGSYITINNCVFSNTNGAPPSDGIDIEPNAPSDRLDHIVIENSTISDNADNGISFGLQNLTANSVPISIQIQNVTTSHNQASGFSAANEHDNGAPGVQGTVLVNQSTSISDGAYGAVAAYYDAGGPAITFQNLTVQNANQNGNNIDNAAIAIKRGGGDASLMGNVYFYGLTVTDSSGKLDHYFTIWDWSYVGLRDIQILNPGQLSNATQNTGLLEGQPVMTVDIN